MLCMLSQRICRLQSEQTPEKPSLQQQRNEQGSDDVYNTHCSQQVNMALLSTENITYRAPSSDLHVYGTETERCTQWLPQY